MHVWRMDLDICSWQPCIPPTLFGRFQLAAWTQHTDYSTVATLCLCSKEYELHHLGRGVAQSLMYGGYIQASTSLSRGGLYVCTVHVLDAWTPVWQCGRDGAVFLFHRFNLLGMVRAPYALVKVFCVSSQRENYELYSVTSWVHVSSTGVSSVHNIVSLAWFVRILPWWQGIIELYIATYSSCQ
jgi:hypothetical protein